MDTGIIVALIFGGANIISAVFFGWIPSRNREKLASRERTIKQQNNDLSFFVSEERMILEEIITNYGGSFDSEKRRIRDLVRETTGKQLSDSFRPGHYVQKNTTDKE